MKPPHSPSLSDINIQYVIVILDYIWKFRKFKGFIVCLFVYLSIIFKHLENKTNEIVEQRIRIRVKKI